MSDASFAERGWRRGLLAAVGAALQIVVATPARTAPLESAAILAEICADEHHAVRRYRAFSHKAREEGNPAVAHFFAALASSESVHARNFLQLLARLGPAPPPAATEAKVQTTRKNLQYALSGELREIDTTYPAHVSRLRQEHQEEAARLATWAWDSEKQHRELITQMEKGTGLFFGILEKTLKSRGVRYFVCQVCGSTYVELPEGACPICLSDHGTYQEVPPSADGTSADSSSDRP